MQVASVSMGTLSISLELPDPEAWVLEGVRWGEVYAFPTPAYWAYQVVARRLDATSIRYKLGSTLRQEVGACLLGGHGIPAQVGLVAFETLRSKGAFDETTPSEDRFVEWLSEPLKVDGRTVRYRFAKQKARYLAGALSKLETSTAPTHSGRALRDWLLACPGIGYKTASWIARNWLDADDVAILDIHLLRAGVFAGVFDPSMTVERDYLALEQRFLAFSHGLGVKPSELDAVIWYIMMSSPRTVQSIVDALPEPMRKANFMPSRSRSHDGSADAHQFALLS